MLCRLQDAQETKPCLNKIRNAILCAYQSVVVSLADREHAGGSFVFEYNPQVLMLPTDDTKLCSYHDVVIRAYDVECLQPGQWLNDQCIELYLLYLQHEVLHGSSDILFMPPSTTFLILHGSRDVASSIMESMNVAGKSTIFFAINNNTDLQAALGGTHWSAMVFQCNTNVCTHYDSIPGMNARAAKHLKDVLADIMGIHITYQEESRVNGQENSYDCGLFCLATAAMLVSRARSSDAHMLVAVTPKTRFEDLNSSMMLSFRRNLKEWVHSQSRK